MVEPLSRVRSSRARFRPLPLRQALKGVGPLGWHAIYFSILVLVSSGIFYGVGRRVESKLGGARLGYLDAVFLGVTSATGAGLANVALSRLDTLQQVVGFLLILAGSQVWVAACVVNIQRVLLARRLLKRCQEEAEKKRRREHIRLEMERREKEVGKGLGGEGMEKLDALVVVVGGGVVPPSPPAVYVSPPGLQDSLRVEVSSPSLCTTAVPSRSCSSEHLALTLKSLDYDYGLWEKETQNQQDRLGALTILSWLIPLYLTIFQLVGTLIIGAWMAARGRDIVAVNALNPWWFAAFNAVSAFNNSGMSLLDANMVPFLTSGAVVVWTHCVLILAGNSAFPIVIKLVLKILRRLPMFHDNRGLACLLDESRGKAVFPYLFSVRETRWLLSMLVLLNGIDTAAFAIAAPKNIPTYSTLLAALFQALSVRSGGFAIVSIRNLHVGVQMTYTLMLYLSAFPLAAPPPLKKESAAAFVGRQFGGLMRAGDLRYLAAAVAAICVVESVGANSVWPVVFEVASAFGCVGISFGAERVDGVALVGEWRGGSKVVLAAVMGWGRVREVRRGVLMGWGQEGEGKGERKGEGKGKGEGKEGVVVVV